MATPKKWSNVAVAMESARAAAKSITGISKASPGVVSSTAHGYTNGDYVLLVVQGMYQVNGRVFRVAGSATDSFSLEGENTTNYDTFTSGNAYKITFGTSIGTITSVSQSGGDFDFIDTTTIHGNQRSQIPGAASPLSYTFDNIWDPSDAGLLALKAAYDAQTDKCFRFTFGTGGSIAAFNGFCGASLAPGGSAQGLVTTSTTITAFGSPTYYAS